MMKQNDYARYLRDLENKIIKLAASTRAQVDQIVTPAAGIRLGTEVIAAVLEIADNCEAFQEHRKLNESIGKVQAMFATEDTCNSCGGLLSVVEVGDEVAERCEDCKAVTAL